MKAVVLAGGFGTRIKPLTYSLPKPMLPLGGKPIIEHVINLIKQNGFDDLTLLLYFQPDAIKNYFGDGSRFGVKINYMIPPEDYGTAGAVKYASDKVKGEEPFLIISGDLLADVDIAGMFAFHEEKDAIVTIGLASVKDPLQFGIVITDKDGRVVRFLEKPGWGEVFSDSVNAGIYIVNPGILDYIPGKQSFDFSHDLFPRLLGEDKPIYGYILSGYWRDVGDPSSYTQANMDILAGRVNVKGSGRRLDVVGKDIWLGEDVALASDAQLEGTVIVGNGVRIEAGSRVVNSIIGNRTLIARSANIIDSVIWDDATVGQSSSIDQSVICSNVIIGKGVLIEPGAVISENCSVGDEAVIREGVKVWPSKEIESRAIVSSNLIWGERWKRSLFEESKVSGLANFELTPEFAAKLGAALASFLPKGSSVLMGRDAYRAPRMIKRAFVAGVLSAGVNVKDLKSVPVPILRYKLQTFGEVGGVYFRYALENPEVTEILFYDSHAFETSVAFEKGFERILHREDFRRVSEGAVGRISDLSGIVDFYREGFISSIKGEVIKERKFRIVVDFAFGSSSECFPSILNELGCEVISLNAYTVEHGSGVDPGSALALLSSIVKATDSRAGFWLDPWAERVYFVDEKGQIYRDLDSFFLLFNLILKAEDSGVCAVPLFAPSSVEYIAKENRFGVLRTKNSVRALSDSAKNKDVKLASYPDGRFIFPEFQIAYDGMFTIAKTLELMARLDIKLSEVSRSIPEFNFRHATVPCPWEAKGLVMRMASQEAMGMEVSFLDGVRISFNGSWVLIFPDQYKSLIHLYAEAGTEKELLNLTNDYTRKIESWIKI